MIQTIPASSIHIRSIRVTCDQPHYPDTPQAPTGWRWLGAAGTGTSPWYRPGTTSTAPWQADLYMLADSDNEPIPDPFRLTGDRSHLLTGLKPEKTIGWSGFAQDWPPSH